MTGAGRSIRVRAIAKIKEIEIYGYKTAKDIEDDPIEKDIEVDPIEETDTAEYYGGELLY